MDNRSALMDRNPGMMFYTLTQFVDEIRYGYSLNRPIDSPRQSAQTVAFFNKVHFESMIRYGQSRGHSRHAASNNEGLLDYLLRRSKFGIGTANLFQGHLQNCLDVFQRPARIISSAKRRSTNIDHLHESRRQSDLLPQFGQPPSIQARHACPDNHPVEFALHQFFDHCIPPGLCAYPLD